MPNLLPVARRALLGLATALLLACSVPAGAGPLVDAVDSITIAVSALERSLPLYEDVLSSEWVSDVEAITNATFAATGKRVRKLPVDTTALKQAL
jgi:hypothetical protein